MLDHSAVKLGKKPRSYPPHKIRMARYVNISTISEPPAEVINSRGVTSWGMSLNGPNSYGNGVPAEGIGDCTIAGVEGAIQGSVLSQTDPTVAADSPILADDGTILSLYSKWCGYVPGDESTDQGGDEQSVLNCLVRDGFMGRKAIAFASIDPTDIHLLKLACWMFGHVYNGLALPLGWQGQSVWDKNAGSPSSWGNHCTVTLDVLASTTKMRTWGMLQTVTLDGWTQYADEAYAIVLEDWKPPTGFDKEALMAEWQAYKGA